MYSANSQFVGGQSIPTFDYDLGLYVGKSFITNICEYLDDNEVPQEDINTIKVRLKDYHKNHNTIMEKENLTDIEHIILDVIGDTFVTPMQCINKAIKKTDRDTYQAMEALVHNLNTMNCMHRDQKVCVYKPVTCITGFNKLSSVEKQALGNLLHRLYEQDNLTMLDICEKLGIGRRFLSDLFDYFGIHKRTKKENSSAVSNRLLRTIGVSNAMKLPENIEKVRNTQYVQNDGKYAFNTEKQLQTNLERHGSSNPMTGIHKQEYVNKCKNTNLERWGTECSLQNPEVLEKSKQTCLKKYGDVYVVGANSSIRDSICYNDLRNPETQAKAKEAQNLKYDGHWGFGDSETSEKIKQTCLEKYGYENPALPMMHGNAKSEDVVYDFLKKQLPDVEIERRVRSLIPSNKKLEVDIYIPEYKFAIEINGSYSHNKDLFLDDMINETCVSKEMKKCKLLKEQGIKLIHIWEDDLREKPSLKLNRILYRLFKWIYIDMNEEDN